MTTGWPVQTLHTANLPPEVVIFPVIFGRKEFSGFTLTVSKYTLETSCFLKEKGCIHRPYASTFLAGKKMLFIADTGPFPRWWAMHLLFHPLPCIQGKKKVQEESMKRFGHGKTCSPKRQIGPMKK